MAETTNNRLENSRNRFQTDVKRVLAVCSAGLLRSPTTANVLHKKYGFNTRAAGSEEDFALIPVDEVLLGWADEVVFVNASNERRVRSNPLFNRILEAKESVRVLDIPDRFEWGDPELEKIILAQYEGIVDLEQADDLPF